MGNKEILRNPSIQPIHNTKPIEPRKTGRWRIARHGAQALAVVALLCGGCQTQSKQPFVGGTTGSTGSGLATNTMATPAVAKAEVKSSAREARPVQANELGMIPVLEYHRFGPAEDRWTRTYVNFRKDLEWLYNNDYVLINAAEMATGQFNIPAGKKPVVLTFDDATAEQFKLAKTADGKIERRPDGKVVPDPNSAVGIMDAFAKEHPDFGAAATFYVLPNPFEVRDEAGEKLRYLVDTGRELGSHTFNHEKLSKLSPEAIVTNLSKAQAEVERVMGRPYRLKTLALPNGIFPKSEAGVAAVLKGGAGSSTYEHVAIMLVGADPSPSPFSKKFNPGKVPRIQATDGEFSRHFNREPGSTARVSERFAVFISDGDPKRVSFPQKLQDQLKAAALNGRTAAPYDPDASLSPALTTSAIAPASSPPTMPGASAATAPASPAALAAPAAAVPTGQILKTHPGYNEPLPEGGEWQDGRIFHTIQKGQSPTFVADRYIKFVTYYTRPEFEKAIMEKNGLPRPMVSIGQRLEIPGVRKAPPKPKGISKPKTFEAKGIYLTMTGASTERVFTLTKRMKPHGLNTIVFDVKDMDGVVSYKTQVPLAVKTGASQKGTIRELPKMIEWLHDQGIHVVARQVLFHDKWLAQHDPRLAIKSKSTGKPWLEHGKQAWVDPNNTEVQDYNIALAKELAGMGVDEIQFDYIRFPAMGNTSDIAYSFDTEAKPKHTIITGFLKRAYETLHPLGVLVSIDVYGVVAWDQDIDVKITGQLISDLSKHADVISPMVYPSHFYPPFDGYKYPAWEPYYFVSQGVARTARKTSGSGIVIRPWLQAFPFMVKDRFKPNYVVDQLCGARDAHATGWLLWDAQNEYIVGFDGVAQWNKTNNQIPAAAVHIAKSGAKDADPRGHVRAPGPETAQTPVR